MAAVRIKYRDPERPDDEIIVGAFGQIAAKRRYGVDAMKEFDPEVALFGCYVELEGPAAAKASPEAFDTWLLEVQDMEMVSTNGDRDDPTTAETQPPSSPASPPTSE